MLDYLKQRYPAIDADFFQESSKLSDAKSIREVMGIEGAVAEFYWRQIQKVIPEKFEFTSRILGHTNRPIEASDAVNCILNYGYSLLEAECLRAINSAGLDPHVGFLHEMQPGKYSLAYDFQELFRFLVDLAVISLIERSAMGKKDFVRTENYILRLKPSGAKKLTEELNSWLNKAVNYQNKEILWDYVIFLKTRELAYYLVGKKRQVYFTTPEYVLIRKDSDDIRKKIVSISYSEWKKKGYSKGALHYMKQNAKRSKPFTLNKHILKRVELWT